MEKKLLTGAETDLETHVQDIINGYAEDYETGARGFLEDLANGGCQSGLVGCLVYYYQTAKFLRQHKTEINSLLSNLIRDSGLGLETLVGWDGTDPLCLYSPNQNLLAWLAFEETARNLAQRNGIEI